MSTCLWEKLKVPATIAVACGTIYITTGADIPHFLWSCVFSKQRAIKHYRDQALTLVRDCFAITGVGLVTYKLPAIFPEVFKLFFELFPYLKALYDEVPSTKRGFIMMLFLIAFVEGVNSTWKYLLKMHRVHLEYRPPAPDAPLFIGTQVVIDKKNSPYKQGAYMPAGVNLEGVIARSVAFYGMKLSSFLYTEATLGLEYPRNVFWRIFKLYARVGRMRHMKTTPHEFYMGMVNTSMVCYLNAETGHLEFRNLRLTYNETDVRDYKLIVIELDHKKLEFVRMIIDGAEVTDSEEAAVVASMIFAIYTHPQVHWWANGATQLEGSWKLAKESSDITQWMNEAATYKSWWFIGNSAAMMANIINNNANQGLPLHSSETEKHVSENSSAHKIVRDCRKALKEMHPEWNFQIIDAIMASTVLHSSDHYYTDLYMSFASQSKVLRYDFSLIRIALFGPNTYYTRKLLCRQRQDDPVAKKIYEIAKQHDADFADNGLFFACAN